MKIQPAVKKETTRIAVGTCALSLVMIVVFALLGRLNLSVWLGTLLGTLVAILNFFLMALSVQKAASRMNGVTLPPEEEADEESADGAEAKAPPTDVPQLKQAKQGMHISYTLRMLMLVAFAILVLSLQSVFYPVPAAIALLFPRVIVSVIGLMDHKRKEEA